MSHCPLGWEGVQEAWRRPQGSRSWKKPARLESGEVLLLCARLPREWKLRGKEAKQLSGPCGVRQERRDMAVERVPF